MRYLSIWCRGLSLTVTCYVTICFQECYTEYLECFSNPRAASDSCMLLLDVQIIVSEVFEYMVQGPELNSNLLCNYLFLLY